MKARYLHERHPGHGLIAATGYADPQQPVQDSPQPAHLDPEGLKSRGIDHFDAWAAAPSAKSSIPMEKSRPTARPTANHAAAGPVREPAELQQMFRTSPTNADGRDAPPAPRPLRWSGKPIVVACPPMSEEQHAIPKDELVARYWPAAVAEGRSACGQRPGHHH